MKHLPIDLLVKTIRDTSRNRVYFMSQRISIEGRLWSMVSGALGWNKDLPKPARKRIEARALALIKYGRKLLAKEANDAEIAAVEEANRRAAEEAKTKKQKAPPKEKGPRRLKALPEQDPLFPELENRILFTLSGVRPITVEEDTETARLDNLADQLPVAAWWKENVFESTRMLGWIIAEAGDLSNYPSDACLWKRMGVAVMPVRDKSRREIGRVRQGAPGPNATKQDWIDHGYRDRRRAVLAVLGDAMVKQNPHYKAIYDRRKKYLQDRARSRGLTILPAARIKAKKKKGADISAFISDGHIHNDAQRYMEKRLLRDLWRAWRRANIHVAERPNTVLPAASLSQAAE